MKRILKFLFSLLLLPFLVFSQAKMGGGISQFTPSLNLDFSQGSMPSGLTFTRNSIATRFNASGVLETVAANVPRLDYDPVTLQPRGILIEESRTNLLTYSDGNSNTFWGNYGSVPFPNISASGGVNNGYFAIRRINANGFEGVRKNVSGLVNGSVYTVSVYARKNPSVNASNVIISSPIGITATPIANNTDLTTVWKRFTLTFTATATSGDFNFYNSSSAVAEGFDICCFQIELGAFATSYIPTLGSAVTRQADNCSMTSIANWLRQGEGTLYSETYVENLGPNAVAVALSDGTSNNRIENRHSSSATNQARFEIVSGNTVQSTLVPINSASIRKLAHSYRLNDVMGASNGTITIQSVNSGIPVNLNTLMIGRSTFGGYLNGHVRKVSFHPRRYYNPYAQSLTQ